MSKTEEGSAASSPHVFGLISDAERYIGINPRLEKAFKFLSRDDLDRIACGRYDIDGEDCWANVVECDLKMPPPTGELAYEVHRAYIDVHIPLSCPETFGYMITPAAAMADFDEENDCATFRAQGERRTVSPGEFALFLPGDGAHAPCYSEDDAGRVRKIIIKIRA